jgi:hypothetical protein
MMAEPAPEPSEEDRLVRWGWGLGLVLPVIGLLIAAVLGARGDERWSWMVGWALLGCVIYWLVFFR